MRNIYFNINFYAYKTFNYLKINNKIAIIIK